MRGSQISWLSAAVVVLLALDPVRAQWGVNRQQRRRGDGAIRPEDIPGGLTFDQLQKVAAQGGAKADSLGLGLGKGGLGDIDAETALEQWTELMKDLDPSTLSSAIDAVMEMPEMQELLADPEKLHDMMRNNPLLKNMPGFEKVLESEDFKDPEKLKGLVEEGMENFKKVGSEIIDVMQNPQKQQELMGELTKGMSREERRRLERLMAGDPDEVEKVASELGDLVKDAFSDPAKMEEARQNLAGMTEEEFAATFKDPDLRAAATDPEKWQKLMQDSAKLMFSSEDQRAPANKGRRRAGKGAEEL